MSNPDFDRSSELWSLLANRDGFSSPELIYLVIEGAPWSKSRPRFARGRTYHDPKDLAAEEATKLRLRQAVSEPFSGNVALSCLFFRPNHQRIDADNLIKHVCDSGNGVAWLDDSQVTSVSGIVEYDKERPRTVLMFGPSKSTLPRGTDRSLPCQVCGKPVLQTPGKRRNTCSRTCTSKYRGFESLEALVPCIHCGKPFKRFTRTRILCSIECRIESLRDTKRANKIPFSKCTECGKALSHSRGGRCRACWCANPAGATA